MIVLTPLDRIEVDATLWGARIATRGHRINLSHADRDRLVAALGATRTDRDQQWPARVRRAYRALRGL